MSLIPTLKSGFEQVRDLVIPARPQPENRLEAIAVALCAQAPGQSLQLRHLQAMIYLVDWRHTVKGHGPCTDTPWFNAHRLPNSRMAEAILRASPYIRWGEDPDRPTVLLKQTTAPRLPDTVSDAVKHILKIYANPEKNILVLASSTHPLMTSDDGDSIDLIEKARYYRFYCPDAPAFKDVPFDGPVFGGFTPESLREYVIGPACEGDDEVEDEEAPTP